MWCDNDRFWFLCGVGHGGELGGKSEADGVVYADGRVWVADGPAVMRDKVGYAFSAQLDSLHFAEFV